MSGACRVLQDKSMLQTPRDEGAVMVTARQALRVESEEWQRMASDTA
ncbi:MAG: hypothetical protein EBE86_012020 [Hormoscilla sp. GUM202]|nr:hypothetical protein [Hormoscilla sp. GUM202]